MFRAGLQLLAFFAVVVVGAVTLPSETRAQQWRLSSQVDPVEGVRRDVASFFSTRGSAYVRCQSGKLEAYVSVPFIFTVDDEVLVRFRFSGGELFSQYWSISTSRDSFFANGPGFFARELARRNSLAMDIYGYNGHPTRVTIPLRGSSAAIRPVLERCEIPTADLDTLLPEVHYRVVDDLERLPVDLARAISRVLLRDAYDPAGPARPLELYRRLNAFWLDLVPAMCLDQQGEYRDMPSCPEFLRRRAANPSAEFPVGPVEAYVEFVEHTEVVIARRERPVAPPTSISSANPPRMSSAPAQGVGCREPDQNPRPSRPFNVERAYPQRLLERGVEGAVVANVSVGADGSVTDVQIISSTPPGAFDSAFDREVRRMRFSPGRQNCENSAGVYELSVQFQITE